MVFDSYLLTNLSVHPASIPWHVRIHLSLTVIWGSRGEVEDQERTSSFRVPPLAWFYIFAHFRSNRSAAKGPHLRTSSQQIPRTGTTTRRPLIIGTWGCSRNRNKMEASVLQGTESLHLGTTIHLSSDKECRLMWLEGLHMNMTNGSLNVLTCNSGTLMANTLHRHRVVDHTTSKVLQLVLVPSSTPSAMDVQIHLPTLPLFYLHELSILDTNFQHPIPYISQVQETLLINTNRVSIILASRDQSPSWRSLFPLTVRFLRLYHLNQSSPDHTRDPWKRTSNQ